MFLGQRLVTTYWLTKESYLLKVPFNPQQGDQVSCVSVKYFVLGRAGKLVAIMFLTAVEENDCLLEVTIGASSELSCLRNINKK